MSLSSTEAEFKAQSGVVTDVLFLKMILEFFEQDIKLPIKAYINNMEKSISQRMLVQVIQLKTLILIIIL